jgi:hypothetical protein
MSQFAKTDFHFLNWLDMIWYVNISRHYSMNEDKLISRKKYKKISFTYLYKGQVDKFYHPFRLRNNGLQFYQDMDSNNSDVVAGFHRHTWQNMSPTPPTYSTRHGLQNIITPFDWKYNWLTIQHQCFRSRFRYFYLWNSIKTFKETLYCIIYWCLEGNLIDPNYK